MYRIPYFVENDMDEIIHFIGAHPLALVTCNGINGFPCATHVPLLISEENGILKMRGHIMRGTDHWKGFREHPDVLAVFSGPNCYVSASWYTNKMSGSTWNYMSVQCHGKMTFLPKDDLIEVLRSLTNSLESDPNSGSNFEDLEDSYVEKMIEAIDAFEIVVSDVQATFKLSQNRDILSYDKIIKQLNDRGGDSQVIAAEMLKRRDKLFDQS